MAWHQTVEEATQHWKHSVDVFYSIFVLEISVLCKCVQSGRSILGGYDTCVYHVRSLFVLSNVCAWDFLYSYGFTVVARPSGVLNWVFVLSVCLSLSLLCALVCGVLAMLWYGLCMCFSKCCCVPCVHENCVCTSCVCVNVYLDSLPVVMRTAVIEDVWLLRRKWVGERSVRRQCVCVCVIVYFVRVTICAHLCDIESSASLVCVTDGPGVYFKSVSMCSVCEQYSSVDSVGVDAPYPRACL